MNQIRLNLLKLLPVFVFMFPLVFLIQVFIFRPYFGNMDDSNLLILAANNDPVSCAHIYGYRPNSGFINNSSMLITWPAYALGSAFGPTIFFATNALLSFSIILFSAYAITKVLNIFSPATILAFVSIAFLWPYTSDLLFFPSLQEKGVILGVALLFFWIHFTRRRRSPFVFWFTFALASIFAFSTKTHIALFLPAIIAALWMVNWRQRASNSPARLVVATALLLLLGFGTVWLALMGDYSAGTQGERNLSYLSDRRFQLLVILALGYSAYLGYRAIKRNFCAIELVPLLIVLPFIASFSVWAVRNYYLSVVSIGLAAMAAVVIANLRSKYVGPIAALFCLAAALVWITWRVPQIYQPLASIQEFLTSTEAQRLGEQEEVVGVFCPEAPTHFNRYAVSERIADLQFEWTGDGLEDVEFVLGDSRLCPFNLETADWELRWESQSGKGYALYRNKSFTGSS
jgi:hypothetical protein